MWADRSLRRRRRAFRSSSHRKRRRLGALLGIVGAVAVAAVAVVVGGTVRDLLWARAKVAGASAALERVGSDPAALRSPEGRAAGRAAMEEAAERVAGVDDRLRRSPFLRAAGAVPGLGAQADGVILLARDAAGAVGSVRDLMARTEELAGQAQLAGGVVPMAGIASLEEAARTAAAELAERARGDRSLWWELGRARRRLDELASTGSDRLATAADAIGAARGFMGAAGDRRYLIAIQNNAEMRAQGMVLSYAVVGFQQQRLVFGAEGSVDQLFLESPTSTPVPAGTNAVFGALAPTRLWQSVNATADFAFSGWAMRDMYLQATGEAVDGVIAVDVPGLAALLRVVGPVAVDGIPEPVSAANAARLLLHDLYQGLPPLQDDPERARKLSLVTRAVIERLTSGTWDAVALGKELGDAARGGHLRLWSADAAEEEVFERAGLGGGPAARAPERTFHLAVENRTATKLDYFVKPSVRHEVRLGPDGSAVVRTSVSVANESPADAGPSFQLGPDGFTERPGDYHGWVLLWAPRGSAPASASVEESGLSLSQRMQVVEAGRARTVVFETFLPDAVRDGKLELRLVPQPRLEPMPLVVTVEGDGWTVGGEPRWEGPWDRVVSLSWPVSR